jgi:hypothetical protein
MSLDSKRYCFLLATILLVAVALYGQSFTAALRGVVTDSSGAVVPGAKVTIIETERNVPHPVLTDEAGRYNATALPPGKYTITVEAQGFKKQTLPAVQLVVQQQATIDFKLEIGDVATTIEVTGSTELLNTTIANLGQVVENKYIISLPNIGRNTMSLTYLTPGVVGSGGRTGDSNTNFVANGSRNSTSDVLLDGVTVVTVEQNSGITDLKFSPSVDAVQEFKMQTNFFSAEYGQTGGAVVNMVTKSGTNNFHGTAYYFLRHSDLNSNSWFSNRAGRARPYYRRDQLGGVIGGPIIKDKTFFFASFERTRSKSPTSQTQSWPTLLQREGDFSKTFNGSGQLMQIYNPFDTFTNAAGNLERRPFSGNIIPKSMMDPIALKMLSYFPKPNQTGAPFTETNNWFEQGINRSTGLQTNIKGDHNFSERSRLTGRYSYSRGVGTPVNLFGEGNPAYTFNDGPNQSTSHAIVGEFTRVQSNTFIWSARYGLTYSTYFRNPMVPNFDLTSLGLPKYMKDNSTLLVFPTIAPEGYGDIGTEGWVVMDRQEGVHHISSSASKFIGGHNLKFGGEYRKNFLDYAQPGYPSGQFSFSRGITCKDRFSCPGNEGNGLATMLLGWWTSNQFHIDPKAFTRSAYWGFFFQDDWKITRKLTLNLGFRYDFDVPRWEKQDRQSYWDLKTQSSIVAAGYDTHGVIKFVDKNKRSPFDSDMNNWQPRIGLAYAIDRKTSIRAGYGLFYQLSRATVFGHTGAGFQVNSSSSSTLDSNATQYAKLSDPYRDGMLLPPGRSQGDKTYIGLSADTILGSNSRNPEYHSWNFSIQREVGWKSIIEVNYTGSRGTHLFLPLTTLAPLPQQYWSMGRSRLTEAVPNPFYGQITDPKASNLKNQTIQRYRLLRPMPQFDGTSVGTSEPTSADSYYHALQLKWEKRYSRGLTALVHYTRAKMIDNASHGSSNYSWLGGSTSIQNIWDLRGERSVSAHDISHRAVITFAYELPVGKGRQFGSNLNRAMDMIFGGWEISGMATFSAGMPLAVTQSGGSMWNGTQRPDLIGNPSTSGRVQDRLYGWYNAAAFAKPAIDVPGTAPRNLNYRGPGIRMFDAALLKSFRVKEGQRFEFRLEAQNVLNHPIFSDPSSSFGSTSFGQITGTKVGPRNVQFGFKYYF